MKPLPILLLAEIIKAYPAVAIRIGGYTDAKRVDAEGYGPVHPVRAANPRIAVRVTAK